MQAIASQAYVAGVPRRVLVSPYPPQIWAEYGECPLVQAFKLDMGRPVGCFFDLDNDRAACPGVYGGYGSGL